MNEEELRVKQTEPIIERQNKYYTNRYIMSDKDRIEVEYQIAVDIHEKYKYMKPNPYENLKFAYLGLNESGYTQFPLAVHNLSGITVYMDALDVEVLDTILEVYKVDDIKINKVAELTSWEILFAIVAWTILHEITHAIDMTNIDLIDVPRYMRLRETTCDTNARLILRDMEFVCEPILLLINSKYYYKKPFISANPDAINGVIDYGNYYYETLKEALQVYGGGYDGEYRVEIINCLQDMLFNNSNCAILDRINNRDNNIAFILKENGIFLPPDPDYINLMNKLHYIICTRIKMIDGAMQFVTIQIKDNMYIGIEFKGDFLFQPFIRKEDLINNLKLPSYYDIK